MRWEELIDRLRRNADFQHEQGWGNDALLREAADAIEWLQLDEARRMQRKDAATKAKV